MVRFTAGRLGNGQKPVRSKYGNRKVTLYGMTFDSKKEAERYLFLRSEQLEGRIRDLCCQVSFEIIPRVGKEREVKYIADFTYRDKDGNIVVEDVKGFKTDVYKLKKKLMLWRFGIEVKEV